MGPWCEAVMVMKAGMHSPKLHGCINLEHVTAVALSKGMQRIQYHLVTSTRCCPSCCRPQFASAHRVHTLLCSKKPALYVQMNVYHRLAVPAYKHTVPSFAVVVIPVRGWPMSVTQL